MITGGQRRIDSPPQIGVLILNRNGKNWLGSIYESIRINGYSKGRVYLVDNASDDGSVEFTLERYPEVSILQMPRNLGYCMAYNLAMPQAFADGCEWVIWANNDIKLEPGCLNELARVAQSDPRIGIMGPAFLAWESNDPNYYILGNYPSVVPAIHAKCPEPIDVDWVEGSFLMVKQTCVEKTGPLDPYLYFYWEETDFCRRARFQGWRVVLVPNALARHFAGGWSARDSGNRGQATWLQARNYYIYQMANPFEGFLPNVFRSVHLFLVNLKESFSGKTSSASFHTRVFLKVLREMGPIYKKWVRDQSGRHPPMTKGDFPLSAIRLIRGETRGIASLNKGIH